MLHQGGFERVCVTTARLLKDYFDITIVIFDDADIAYDIAGLKIVNLNIPVIGPRILKPVNILRRARKLKRIKKQLLPFASYSFGSSANIANCLSKVKGQKTWVGLRSYLDMFDIYKIRLFISRADRIICCAKVIEDELRSKYGYEDAVTLYNPYDVEKICKEANEEVSFPWDGHGEDTDCKSSIDGECDHEIFNLMCMGREDDVKGYWHAIKALCLIRKKVPGARLVFIGDGDFGKYKKLANDLGIAEYVFFAGLAKNPYKYLKKGSVYLLTSENEGFPNALVEGMLLGNAAVAVDCVCGPAEILDGGRYGILLPDFEHGINLDAGVITDEEVRFAAAVTELLCDKEKLNKYRELAVKRAGDFSHSSYIKSFLDIAKNDMKR